ncbi:MAG: hypothetical protein II970_05680 [Paludibacteraceae bacterium]|nr:hypothetical protein [Paludibacteraceae bacterium]
MKKLSLLHYIPVCLLAAATALPAAAQQRRVSSYEKDYIFWGSPDAYLNYQAKTGFPLIDQMLQAYPPTATPDKHRQMALVSLDQFLHDEGYTRREAFYTFVNSRMAHLLEDMNRPVLSGVRIYKLYNSGFILKTLKNTIAIDIVQGGGSSSKGIVSDSVIYEIAYKCDALIITNTDERHASRKAAKAFAEAGKKVILPKGLWTNLGEALQPAGADTVQTIELDAMTLHILPGHNGSNRNNICIMDLKGCGIVAHTGAQDNAADLTWIEHLHEQYKTDILLTKSQNLDLESIVSGFRPRVLITANENEMERSVDMREAYWTTQKRVNSLTAIDIPNIIMAWGEAYDYADTESENISSSASKVMIDGVLYIERKGAVYTPSGVKVK